MSNKASPKIAFIQSSWHADIVERARVGFAERLGELGVNAGVEYFRVPGAMEIPLKCKQLLATGNYAMAIGAGLVVDGGIYRHEFVAQAVINGLMQVQLELGRPVLSVVLTPQRYDENNAEHHQFFLDHMVVKGAEAAEAAAMLLAPPGWIHALASGG